MANSLKEYSRVIETSASTGPGDLVLAGPISGMRAVGSVLSNGETALFLISKDTDWEVVWVTYSASGNSISRDTVMTGTNGTTPISWGAGDKTIRLIRPGLSDLNDAARAALLELAMTVSEITVASDATCDILGAASPRVAISGTTTITSLGTAANKMRFVRATGAFTLTHHGTSLICPGGANLSVAAGDTFIVMSDSSGNARIFGYQPAAGFLLPHIAGVILSGCELSNNATDATNDIDIAAGYVVSDDGAAVMTVPAITKQLDAAWAVGDDEGGLDTGSIANTTYHLFAIQRSDTLVVDVLFSASLSPTMPTDYDRKAYLGAILREGGAIVGFSQHGAEFERKVPIDDTNVGNPGTSAVLVMLSIPNGIVNDALLSIEVYDGSPAAFTRVLVTSPAQTDTSPGTVYDMSVANSGVANFAMAQTRRRTNTSRQVRYRLSNSDAGVVFKMATRGWINRQMKRLAP